MKRIVLAMAMLMVTATAFAQKVNKEEAMKNLKAQSSAMIMAFKDQNVDKFMEYSHPKVVEMMGGKEGFKERMDGLYKQFDAAGISFTKAEVGEPTSIIVVENELQSSVEQNVEVKMPDGQTEANTSTLVAQSTDGGKTWVFVDASGASREQLKMLMPNLSDEIKILPAE